MRLDNSPRTRVKYPYSQGPSGRLNAPSSDGEEVTVRVNETLTTCIAAPSYYTVGYYSSGAAGLWLDGEGGVNGSYEPGTDTLLTTGSGLTDSAGVLTIDDANFAVNQVTIEWQLVNQPTINVSGFNGDDKIRVNLDVNFSEWLGAQGSNPFSGGPPTNVENYAEFSSTNLTENFYNIYAVTDYNIFSGSSGVQLVFEFNKGSTNGTMFGSFVAVGLTYASLASGGVFFTNPMLKGLTYGELKGSQFDFILPSTWIA